MSWSFRIDSPHRLVRVQYVGATSRADFTAARREVEAHPAFDPTFDLLMDVSDADLRLSAADVEALSSSTSLHATSRRALVAGKVVNFGLLRMYQARRDLGGGRETSRVFTTMEEALAWLGARYDEA